MSKPRKRLARLRSRVRLPGPVASLPWDEQQALVALARTVASEHSTARRSPSIHRSAWISPLASIRFAERVDIGADASIGPFCCVWGGWTTTWARVGARALLSPGVVLVAGNHRTDGPGAVRDLGFEERDVVIGDGAWVGAHAVVVGCQVGEGAVIGAGAVVLDDVPDRAIAVGSPARVVSMRSP